MVKKRAINTAWACGRDAPNQVNAAERYGIQSQGSNHASADSQLI